MENLQLIIAFILIAIFLLIWFILYLLHVRLFFLANKAGVHFTLFQLLIYRYRGIPPAQIIKNLIDAKRAGLELPRDKLALHYVQQLDSDRLVEALIKAKKTGLKLDFETAERIQMVGKDILQLVEQGQFIHEFELPPIFVKTSRDGIGLMVEGHVKATKSLDQFIGREKPIDLLTERVSAALISAISQEDFASNVLNDPTPYEKQAIDEVDLTDTGFSDVEIKITPSLDSRPGS